MRLVLVFLVSALLILTSWWVWGEGMERWLTVDFLKEAGGWAWMIGLGLLTADFFLPLPATVVISGLGYVYGTVVGGLLGALGLMMAGVLGYGVGRCLGEGRTRHWLGGDFEKGRRWFERGGGWMVALSRALPILPEVISCSAGLLGMPFGRFLAALACGSLPMGFIFAWVGALGRISPGLAVGLSVAIPAMLWLGAAGWKKIRS